ncbi:MAG: nicotinate phosphoribosyltransferase [Erysipelotrichales bacterium]|nr:nicotinate phosphoribosyltransferase [Erysipelotrichales bacterium]
MKLYNGYENERLARNYTLLSDQYQFNMGCGYLVSGKKDTEAVFDVFFRKVPTNGGYAVMAGLDKIIPFIQNLKFDERDLDYFRRNNYPEEYIEYLKNFKFHGTITAIPDGTPVFPNEPLITVKAPIIEAQILETCILSIINGAMEHATGARRIIEATPDKKDVIVFDASDFRKPKDPKAVMEFGLRRADGPEAGIDASIYGIMAGCAGTSNVMVANMLNIKAMGTMAHSWIEAFDSEYEAFLNYAKIYPQACTLLVDTFDTLKSGVPNAIKVFEYMKENGMSLDNIGIRIDSGDLAYLSKEARRMLDAAGFPQAKICLSNGLNANTIEDLTRQGACFDTLGVGDNISKPEGRMGCVYKLVAENVNGIWQPKIKLSDSEIKIVNPDHKTLYRAYDKTTGYALADIMTRQGEIVSNDDLIIIDPANASKSTKLNNFELRELHKPIFVNGELVYDDPNIEVKKDYCNNEMATLYPEVRRTTSPHLYHVSGTEDYVKFKQELIEHHKSLVLK